jgi:deoxyribonuclease-1
LLLLLLRVFIAPFSTSSKEFTKKGKVNQRAARHGACDVKIDFKQRVIQPPKSAKNTLLILIFYMQKTYGLKYQINNKTI